MKYLDLTHVNDSLTRIIYPRNGYSKNLSFLRVIQIQADISQCPLVFLSTDDAIRIFNADNAAIYKFRNSRAYKERYHLCKDVHINENCINFSF